MSDLLFARGQMALSLVFHIIFAAIGIAMPLFMVIAEIQWRRTGDAVYLKLAKSWAKGTAVLFAVGAVSGTVLSFELGLLFPEFMRHAGGVIGMPFSLEGFAFFTEAIFLGIYLYGRDRVAPRWHLAAGVVVAVSGALSALFVILANAWMNAPTGFTWHRDATGQLVISDVDPIAAMLSPHAAHQVVHMLLAAYLATALAMAGVHAWALLRGRANRALHGRALAIALAVAIPGALAQGVVGHWSGQVIAREQPMKLAAIEGLVKTQSRAPLHVGPVAVPGLLSLMAFNDPDAVVRGLEEIPRADWPHPITRWAFQAMVGMGGLMILVMLWAALRWWRGRRRPPATPWWDSRRFLQALIMCAPLGFLAIEAGWIVTEVGRQPWVITGVLRTAEAATPMPGLVYKFVGFTIIYLGLGVTVAWVLARMIRASASDDKAAT